MRFRDLPLRLQILILLKTAAAGLWWAWVWSTAPPANWGMLCLLAACCMVGSIFKVDAQVPGARITMGFIVTYFSFLLLGTSAAMAVSVAGTVAAFTFKMEDPARRFTPRRLLSYRTLYNCANGVIAIGLMGLVYEALGGRFGILHWQSVAVPVLASALTYYAVNGAGAALAVAWSQRRDPVETFRTYCAGAWSGFLASASISVGLVWAHQTLSSSTVALLFIPPAFLIYYTYVLRSEKMRKEIEHMQELGRLNDSIITSLAMAIDAKDHHTSKHTSRVREYAVALSERLQVSPDELQAVRIASLLHDVGKIGIPESILCKPGKLTAEEFEVIKTHVEIGAAILEQIHFPWPVVPIVRGHHERWDGLGYPQKLKGEEIPIGARVISLVDVYDALTSERPYRKAMTREQAVGMLRAGAGTQFDPRVVDMFVELLPEMDARLEALEAADEAPLPQVTLPHREAVREDDPERDAALLAAWQAAAAGATGAQAASVALESLKELVPYASAALLRLDPLAGVLRPELHAGMWEPLFRDLEIRQGEGISGFVAAGGEAPANAAASLDLARRLRPGENLELNSTLCVPLRTGERVTGVLTLYHSGYNFYQPWHQRRLRAAAEVLGRLLDSVPEAAQGSPSPADPDRETALASRSAQPAGPR